MTTVRRAIPFLSAGLVHVRLLSAVAVLSPVGGAWAANDAITIDAQFQEEHVRLDDPRRNPIVWTRHLRVLLSGAHDVQENWESTSSSGINQSGSNNAQLGFLDGNHVWHVLGARQLVRTQTFLQHTMTMTINILPDRSCQLKVVYRLKPGFSDMFVPRADNNVMTHFTLPRTLAAACTIS